MEYSGNYDDVNGLYEEALDLATIDDEECIRCYDEIIGINSGEGMAWRGKGLALGRLGRPQEAIDCFDKALEIDPYDDISQRSKNIELEEIKAIDTMTHSLDVTSLVTKGLDLHADGKDEEAIQCYDKALKINPNDESVWENKANALGSLDKDEEAIQCYDKALEINPENDYALAMKASHFVTLEKYEEAIQCYDKALEINPENDRVLAMKDQLTKFHESYLSDLQKVKDRNLENISDPSNAFMEGMALLELKKYEEAISYFKKAIPSPEVDGGLGMCLRKVQKYDESITYFDKALSVEPENEMYLSMKGFSLHDLKRYDELVIHLTKLLKINPLNDSAWNNKGIALFELSKYDEATFCYNKALEIVPDESIYLSNKGECLDKLSKYPESISCYERALEKDPNNEEIQKNLDSVKAKLSNDSSSETDEKIEVIEKNEPLDVLKMRLVKGEITPEEFNKIKEHLEYDVEGIKKEFEDELNDELASWEERVKNLPKEPDEKLEEVEKLKTRNPYKAKGVIIGLIFVILFIPFFIVGGYFVANITFMVTDKMSPLIEENDWVHKSDTPISEINYNDIIFYTSSDKLMVNKVVGIIADERVDYIFTVKNTASPTIKKVTENQYVGKMDFIVGNFGEYGKIMLIILNFIFFPQMIILLSAIGFIVPIIVMRHRAKINV
jgi:tetratricopeptide (TPR) repeat protein